MSNFLEAHYIRYMEAGGSHASYVVWNELDDDRELCERLKVAYAEYKKQKNAVPDTQQEGVS